MIFFMKIIVLKQECYLKVEHKINIQEFLIKKFILMEYINKVL